MGGTRKSRRGPGKYYEVDGEVDWVVMGALSCLHDAMGQSVFDQIRGSLELELR